MGKEEADPAKESQLENHLVSTFMYICPFSLPSLLQLELVNAFEALVYSRVYQDVSSTLSALSLPVPPPAFAFSIKRCSAQTTKSRIFSGCTVFVASIEDSGLRLIICDSRHGVLS